MDVGSIPIARSNQINYLQTHTHNVRGFAAMRRCILVIGPGITHRCDVLHRELPLLTAACNRRIRMLVKDVMRKPIVACTPGDSPELADTLMKRHCIHALPVVLDIADPLLEGIVTDRDLCSCVAAGQTSIATAVADVMTRVPITCQPENTLEECQELMRKCAVRRVPVVDASGRCVGIVSWTDIAPHASLQQLAAILRETSKTPVPHTHLPFDEGYFYCGQLHELDQIALLEWRRRQATAEEVHT
jgi:CBS domain-containing protein